jgi:PAS domain S-box-containing protein
MMRVLLVDDSADFLQSASRALGSQPAVELAGVARSGREAIDQVARLHPDVVVMDVAMPGMNGFEAARAIKRDPSAPFVIMLTMFDGPEYRMAATQAGADGFVSKLGFGEQLPAVLSRLRQPAPFEAGGAEAQRRSEARYRALIEATLDGYVFHEDGVIVDANQGFASMFGYQLLQVVGRSLLDFVDEAERDRVQRLISGAGQGELETVGRRRDGSLFPLEVFARSFGDGSERVNVAGVRDISARRTMEQQLLQAQKMEAVGRLAGGVAHDFNNLLTAIIGTVELLLGDLAPEDPRREDLESIRATAKRGAELTRQLLVFSRRERVELRPLDVNAVVRNVERLLKRVIGEDIALKADLAPSLGLVECDPGQLEQVLMNLAVNARDAMPTGGTLTLETRTLVHEPGAASGLPLAEGRYVVLTVRDTGSGMDEETKSRAFEPFFTTKEAGKGTGLGLATVYSIVKQAGGHVKLLSARGRGTRVEIYLPESPEQR